VEAGLLGRETVAPIFKLEAVAAYQHTLAITSSSITSTATGANADTLFNTSEATSVRISGTLIVNGADEPQEDVLVGIYAADSNTLLYWTIINNTSTTATTFSTTLDLTTVLGSYEGGIIFRLWQGTAANTTSSGTYTGTSPGLPNANTFDVNPAIGTGAANRTAATPTTSGVITTSQYTLDRTPPGIPTINQVAGDDRVNSSEKTAGVTLSGTAEAGSTVSITWGGTTLTATAVANGNWTRNFTSAQIPADSTTTITVTAKDAAGNTSTAGTRSVLVDTTAPTAPSAPDLQAGSDSGSSNTDNITNVTAPTFDVVLPSGIAVGDIVTLYSGTGTTTPLGSKVVTAADLSAGRVSITTSPLAQANYTITARFTDVAGNQSAASSGLSVTIDTTPPAIAPAISSITDNVGTVTGTIPTNGSTDDTVLVLNGTAAAGSTVTIFNGTTQLGTATANGGGNWQFTTAMLTDGTTYSFTATVTNTAGNSRSSSPYVVTVDTTAPGAPTITSIIDDVAPVVGTVSSGSVTNDTVLVVNGTAEANSTVTIFNGATQLGTATANGTGAWTFTTGTLTNGTTYNFTAKATDVAGNQGNTSTAYVVTVDTAAPTITSGNTGAVAENAATTTVIYTATTTDTGSLTYSLSGEDAALLNINSSTGVVTLKNSADFETKSSYSFNVLATDAAGNASAPKAVVVGVTNVDEVAPTITSGATGTVAENAAVNTVIYTASATDTDFAPGTQSLTYSLSGEDADLLNIDAATGAVTLKASADFETKDSYSFSLLPRMLLVTAAPRTCWLALPTWMKWRPLSPPVQLARWQKMLLSTPSSTRLVQPIQTLLWALSPSPTA
jgi:hypothetical protein